MTTIIRRHALVTALCLSVATAGSGCTTTTVPHELHALRETDIPPGTTPFEKTLAQHYYVYAEELRQADDSDGSEVMARRALLTLRGATPRAETPGPDADLDLRQAYGYAASALSDAPLARAKQEESARLRFLFDCWSWESRRRQDGAKASACREAFFAELEKLHASEITGERHARPAANIKRVIEPIAAVPAVTKAALQSVSDPARHVRVPFNRAGNPAPDRASRAKLKAGAAKVKKASPSARVVAEGYAYGAKSEKANLAAAFRYALAARALLAKLGVPVSRTDVRAMGSLPDEKGAKFPGAVVRFPPEAAGK